MYILYDFIFLIFSIIYLPYLILTHRYHSRLAERFGIFDKDFFNTVKNKKLIWLHAVSVGEVIAASPFIKSFHTDFPDYKLLISTVTKTGNSIASTIKGADDILIFFPLDLSFIIRKFLNKVNPRLFIIIETELWPNIITILSKKKIPVVLINGRLSLRSFRAYGKVKLLLKGILRRVDLFCMRTPDDAARLKDLGVSEGKIKITGNMKYDAARSFITEDEKLQLKRSLGLDDDEKVFIAGSTHRGEEEVIFDAYKELLNKFPQLRLLIAPRHIERVGEIEDIISRYNFNSRRFSSSVLNDVEVIVLDIIGKLKDLYAISDIVFMGGSLFSRYGGHNILEPASFKKPILFGPYMANFKDMADEFLKENAAIQVRDKEDIEKACNGLLTDETKTKRYGDAAFNIIEKNKGATHRNTQCIKDALIK